MFFHFYFQGFVAAIIEDSMDKDDAIDQENYRYLLSRLFDHKSKYQHTYYHLVVTI